PGVAAVSRRQGGGHRIRRLPGRGSPGCVGFYHFVRHRLRTDALCFTGLDPRCGKLSCICMVHRKRSAACLFHFRAGHRRAADHREASSQYSPPAGRQRTSFRSRQDRMTILPMAPKIVVLGSGAWGTALALSLARNGRTVKVWAHSPEAAKEIVDAGENVQFLPGFRLPPAVTVTGDNAAVTPADIIVSVVPSEFLRSTLTRLSPHMRSAQIIVSATKGVETGPFLRMTQLIAQNTPGLSIPIGALSGPSFAQEVAEGQPTAITVAFDDPSISGLVQREFSSESLRLY